MKKQFKTLFSYAAAVFAALTLAACGEGVNIDTPANIDPETGIEIPTGKSLFSSGEASGMPVINADADGEAKAINLNLNEEGTRTSMGGKAVNTKFPFYWEPGDKIWVKNGATYTQSAPTSITATQPKAQFMVDGTFTASPYEVYYAGQNCPQASQTTANALQVTIADQQTQSAWNNSAHIGTSGDCGTGYAHLQNNGSYTFTIDHKASYLIFYPYLHVALQNGNYTLQKIEIYSDLSNSNIAGTYNFDFTNGLLNADLTPKTPVAGTAKQAITLTCGDAFGLTTAVPDLTTNTTYNHCFAVIAPGTHELTVIYTLKNTATNVEYTVIKDITPKQYAENSVYTFIHELRYFVTDEFNFEFNEATCYRWGSVNEVYSTGGNTYDYVTTGQENRISNGFWSTFPDQAAAQKYCGSDIYYDNAVLWKYNRRDGTQETMRGGWWFTKKAYLTENYSWDRIPTNGRPDQSVRDLKFFFLPKFRTGMTYIWTAAPATETQTALAFTLLPSVVHINYASRNSQITVAGTRPDGTAWFQ